MFKEPEISLKLKGLELCSPESDPKSIKTLIPKDLLRKALRYLQPDASIRRPLEYQQVELKKKLL